MIPANVGVRFYLLCDMIQQQAYWYLNCELCSDNALAKVVYQETLTDNESLASLVRYLGIQMVSWARRPVPSAINTKFGEKSH